MSRYDQVSQMLYDVATSDTVRLPDRWYAVVPPIWIGMCGCCVHLSYLETMSGRCHHCHKGYRRLPYMNVLLAAWLLGGPSALRTAAEGLFNDLQPRPV